MSPIILLLLSPAVIGPIATGLISLIKRAPKIENIEDQSKRNLLLRGLAALLSLGGVLGAFMVTGITPDATVVSDIVITLVMVFTSLVSSLGFHNLLKR